MNTDGKEAAPILELRDIEAGYGATHVLRGINLTLRKGERLAIIGRNGVGKTTTLATIMGLTRLHGGTIRLKGEDITQLPAHKRSRMGLGLVPQTRDIFPSLTVEENLVAGLRGTATLEEAYALFPRLKERRRNGGTQLSGGEMQMLSIARTLLGRPEVLLLDEPLEGLAPVICDMLMGVFERLAAQGDTTLVLVEQHTALALDFAERVIILDGGRIVHEGSAAHLKATPGLLDRHAGVALAEAPAPTMPATMPAAPAITMTAARPMIEGHVAVPAPPGVPVWDIDPYAEDILANPEPYYAELRARGPFVYFPKYAMLACGRYAETREVFSDYQRFVSSRGIGLTDFKLEKPWRPPSVILEVDPPDHTKTRTAMARSMSPKALAALKAPFQAAADALIDQLLEKGTFDAVHDLAESYPVSVFPQAVGLANINARHLVDYGAMVFNGVGPDNALRRRWMARGPEIVPWIMEQCRRENLKPGGFGQAIYAFADSGDITHEEAGMLVRSLLSAGVDTTVTGIGNAVWCFANNPAQFELLKADLKLVKGAFEETLRYTSPVHTFLRTANMDTTVSGVAIQADTKIMCVLGSANLDENHWPNADRFDITRKTAGHLAFGVGIHGCVGQMVARAELDAVLTALAQKVGSIELAGTPVWRPNNAMHALDTLPVTFRRRD
jgi:4-methoxybenzoate monooxygenase (O-demethylating)